MGQKDLTAKQFENVPEVFADVVNALIYEGEQVLLPADLRPAPTESFYPSNNGMLRNQYSDMSKYEIKRGRIVMQYTLENQSWPDYRILFRKAGYEGAIYRQQYDGGDTYPTITLVLYWGDTVWNSSSDLYKFFRRKGIHRMARKYIDNIRLHMYPMKSLPKEIRQRFKSDMRVVVDYLAEGKQYEPTEQEIVNLDGTMRMLHALTGETDFIDNIEALQERVKKGERITMCEVVDKFVERGRKQGIQQGILEGMQEEKLRCARAFISENMVQRQSKEYIMGILQTCFQLQEEEAVRLYRESTA